MPFNSLRLKHPIILVHGLGARSRYGPVDYFFRLPPLLKAAGNTVSTISLTPWDSIPNRALQLKQQIESSHPEGSVNIIAHSMGGLDARYLASSLDFASRISSLTTIGTPHRGTSLADIVLGLISDSASEAIQGLLRKLNISGDGLKQLTCDYHQKIFMNDVPNSPDVAYYSATSSIAPPVYRTALPFFWPTHRVLQRLEGENDGFVSVESARWGEHICTYSGDHYAQVGQFLGFSRGMDYISFYQEILSRLQEDGF